MPKRVLIAGFKHETNTFSKLPTTLDSYRARGYYRGNELTKVFTGTNTEIAGFLDTCAKHGFEAVLSRAADATPSGKVTRDAYEAIAAEIVADAKAAEPDAILLNLHGAMVAESTDDGEGTLLQRLREVLGRDVLIGVTLDLHANVTDLMAREADAIVSYRTYPHIDMYDTGIACGEIIARALKGEIKPATIVKRADMLIGIDQGRTTAPGPMTELIAKADAMKSNTKGVLSISPNAGFAWADIREVGPTIVVVGDGRSPAYDAVAEELAADIWSTRDRKTVTTVRVADAVATARARGKPGAAIVIADYADNPGGGGYGDSTGLLRGMIDARLENAAFAAFYDPETAALCHKAGVGATLNLAIGGKVDSAFGKPVEVTATVMHLSDGKMVLEGPMMRGVPIDMGPTAAVKVGGVEIVLGSRRFQNYDRMYFKVAGIDPATKSVLAVKSSQHFRAAYAPLAAEIVVVDEGGGIMSTNFSALPYKNVRRPIYPIDKM
jgi:microcystin degradation protein MlrC